MAMSRVFFSDLKSGRCSSTVEVRLLRFWEARNPRRGGELMWFDLLMVDVNSTMMHASINASHVGVFRPKLTAGNMYCLSDFEVSRCGPNFRLTDSPLMIRFAKTTGFDELTDPVSPLPKEGFRFRNHSELIGLANTGTQLPDIVGELLAVKSTVSDPPEEKNRVMATIKLESNESVTLSLFDAEAVAFHHRLDNMRIDPKVIVATSINPKLVGGRLFLNATSGTHIYFDKETSPGETFFYRLVARDTGLPPAAPLLKGYAKVETLTIAELNAFIITAPSQAIDFICSGVVRRVELEKGWCYVACSKCSKKLHRTVNSFTCERCVNSHAVGSLRYRVEMVVADDTAEGMFVCFDGVMTKLHSLKASEAGQMLAGDGVNPEDTNVPPFITDMEGKTFTFQVRVSEYNFSANHQTFTITRILKTGDRHPVPDFVGGDGGDGNAGAGGKQISATLGDCTDRLGEASAVVSSAIGGAPEDFPSASSTVVKKARLEKF